MQKINFILPLLLICFYANAQKLPNVQAVSLRAPANIKIDGKATEWNNQFQAYNKAVEVYYSLSNDNDNLYLVVQATKPRIIEKIISVGITFTVNTDKKTKYNDANNISLTFPLIDVAYGQSIIKKAGAKAKSDVPVPVLKGAPVDTSDYTLPPSDSLKIVANKMLAINAKTIKVKGVKEIVDEQLSVYNEEKIKVAQAFNNSAAYTYELAIPLKYLKLNTNTSLPFAYSIKLESRLTEPKKGLRTKYVYINNMAVDVDQDLDGTTDLWSEYTLAK